VLEGLDGFSTQQPLGAENGEPGVRVDFCFRSARLVVEVDGARWHQDVQRDRRRDNALARLGWRVMRFTWADVVHDSTRVVREIRAALAPSCTHPAPRLAAAS
jgi:very-short-patch-repair endonuclease